MQAAVSHHAPALPPGAAPYAGISRPKFAMWLFLASEVMFFTGLIGAYIVLRAATEWPDPATVLDIPLTALNTFILIVSSVTMVRTLYRAQAGDRAGMKRELIFTIVLGTIFLSVQAYEWNQLLHHGLSPSGTESLLGATFYTLTGFHGAHVLGGVLLLLYLFTRAQGGAYGADDYESIELAGLYWHFVDLVWIILFTILYLI
jgi:heme/copper-type cytochrome/quinol oxidase subunit 3